MLLSGAQQACLINRMVRTQQAFALNTNLARKLCRNLQDFHVISRRKLLLKFVPGGLHLTQAWQEPPLKLNIAHKEILTLKAIKNEENIAAHSGTLEKFTRKKMSRIDKHGTL